MIEIRLFSKTIELEIYFNINIIFNLKFYYKFIKDPKR